MNDMTRVSTGVEAPARFSISEFMGMVDAGVFDGWKVELVEGEVVRMSPAMNRHMHVQRELLYDLNEIFGRQGEWIVQPEATVQLGERTLRDIDVAVVKRFAIDRKFIDPATVRLAVEVSVSTLAYDLKNKRADYAASGIADYWVVDVEKSVTHVLTDLADGDFRDVRIVPFGEPLPVPGTDRSITIA